MIFAFLPCCFRWAEARHELPPLPREVNTFKLLSLGGVCWFESGELREGALTTDSSLKKKKPNKYILQNKLYSTLCILRLRRLAGAGAGPKDSGAGEDTATVGFTTTDAGCKLSASLCAPSSAEVSVQFQR